MRLPFRRRKSVIPTWREGVEAPLATNHHLHEIDVNGTQSQTRICLTVALCEPEYFSRRCMNLPDREPRKLA